MTPTDLLAAGFQRMEPHHFVENPLRTYLVVPVREDSGGFFGVPMFFHTTADPDLYRQAERVAVERYGLRIASTGLKPRRAKVAVK